MNDKVSVIIPVYNLEHYIDKCLKSVLSQNHTNLEIIIVDDGSTDNSPDIIAGYALHDARIRIIRKENEGVGNAVVDGVKASTGKNVCFVDGDDYVKPNFIGNLLSAIEESGADLAACNFETDENSIEKLPDKSFTLTRETLGHSLWEIIDFYSDNPITTARWNKIYRRELLESTILYLPKNLRRAEDYYLNYIYLYHADKVRYIPDKLYFYRARSDSLTKGAIYCPAWKKSIQDYEFFNNFVSDEWSRNRNLLRIASAIHSDVSHMICDKKNDKELKAMLNTDIASQALTAYIPRLKGIKKLYVMLIKHKKLGLIRLIRKIIR